MALCLLLGLGVGAAEARRLALVIGNAAYSFGGKLDNPVNDASEIAKRLRDLHFEVTERHDLGGGALRREISAFKGLIGDHDTVVIYYAGHGMEVDGRDYLLPVDADLRKPSDVDDQGFPLDRLYPSDVHDVSLIIFFDACRNSAFPSSVHAAIAGTTALTVPPGSQVVFSTSGGKVAFDGALDGGGQPSLNGLFAQAMSRALYTARTTDELLRETRSQVRKHSNDQQVPQIMGLLEQTIVLNSAPPEPRVYVDNGATQPRTEEAGGGVGNRSFENPPLNPFCHNAPAGSAPLANDPQACPNSDAPASTGGAGYAQPQPQPQRPAQRIVDAPPPRTEPTRPAPDPAPAQVFTPAAARPAIAASPDEIQALIDSQDTPEQKLMRAPRAAHETLGAFSIADLGPNTLPRRPVLRTVPPIKIPPSFCSQFELNDFHDKVYKPAFNMAFDNNLDAGQYINHLERLRREYVQLNSKFVFLIVWESVAYTPIARAQFDQSEAYRRMHDAIVATPVRNCH